jgi:hypothetical protein
MRYQYQIDYGAGYEDAAYGGTANQEENPAAWFAAVEAEGLARRARVLSGNQVTEERVFDVAVTQSRTQPDGSTQHLVHGQGGDIIVDEHSDGRLSGSVRLGYVGDQDRALERAFKAVKDLSKGGG